MYLYSGTDFEVISYTRYLCTHDSTHIVFKYKNLGFDLSTQRSTIWLQSYHGKYKTKCNHQLVISILWRVVLVHFHQWQTRNWWWGYHIVCKSIWRPDVCSVFILKQLRVLVPECFFFHMTDTVRTVMVWTQWFNDVTCSFSCFLLIHSLTCFKNISWWQHERCHGYWWFAQSKQEWWQHHTSCS